MLPEGWRGMGSINCAAFQPASLHQHLSSWNTSCQRGSWEAKAISKELRYNGDEGHKYQDRRPQGQNCQKPNLSSLQAMQAEFWHLHLKRAARHPVQAHDWMDLSPGMPPCEHTPEAARWPHYSTNEMGSPGWGRARLHWPHGRGPVPHIAHPNCCTPSWQQQDDAAPWCNQGYLLGLGQAAQPCVPLLTALPMSTSVPWTYSLHAAAQSKHVTVGRDGHILPAQWAMLSSQTTASPPSHCLQVAPHLTPWWHQGPCNP